MPRRQSARTRGVVEEQVLPRHGEGDPDLQHELLVLEMALLRAFRARRSRSQTKRKIVDALRARN